MMIPSSLLAAALIASSGTVGPAGEPPSDSALTLLRCAPGSHAACVRITLPGGATTESVTDPAAWSVTLGGNPLADVRVRGIQRGLGDLRLLVLVDVSGSMVGRGIQDTRLALRTFLADLPAQGVTVAVAPFSSRHVRRTIEEVRFGSPAQARAQLEALPRPAGNTGLYTAVAAAARRLSDEVAAAPPGAGGALLVITDGRNDAGQPGDDPDLLVGPEGRTAAVAELRQSGVRSWMVGVGAGVDARELMALAKPRGAHYLVPADPYRQGELFAQIRTAMFSAEEIIARVPDWLGSRLARSRARLVVTRIEASPDVGSGIVRWWQPPIFGLPLFAGRIVDTPYGSIDSPVPWAGAGARTIQLLVSLLVLGLAWIWLPRRLWPDEVAAMQPAVAPPLPERPITAAEALAPIASPGGLAAGIAEAPPRRPTDVTAAPARRIIRRS